MAAKSIKDDLENLKSHVDSMEATSQQEGGKKSDNTSASNEEETCNADEMLRRMTGRLEAEKNRLLKEWKRESGKVEKVAQEFSGDKQQLESEIRAKPLTSIAIAFGAGFILARLFGR